MLPLQQAREVARSIQEYIHATFAFNNEAVEKAFYDFIEHPVNGMIKGPYISLKTPFVAADPSDVIPLEIKPGFTPHAHQMEAFKWLTTQDGNVPKPTLLTTGTGSGKTESFEFPVLDYCYKHRDQRGIKVIILYPMNALATDQAKRLAKDIWNDPRLKGNIRAGLFIGKGDAKAKLPDRMGEDNIIEDRNTIVKDPPDILLTNFKMLDLGIMQSKYANLWSFNVKNPELLKFIILDELHTYDGAQGTDVANLLRRLKMRLNIPNDYLCPVGTSATLGSGDDAKEKLCEYASAIFGERVTTDAIIEEQRQSDKDLFPDETQNHIPTISNIMKMSIGESEDYESYITKLKNYWRIKAADPIELGEELSQLTIVRQMVSLLQEEGVMSLSALITRIATDNEDFRKIDVEKEGLYPREIVIESLLALIAEAKRPVGNTGRLMPFLFLQVQLWVRELSGIRRFFGEKPEFTWKDSNVKEDENKVYLPAWFCRDCGASGWYMLKPGNADKFDDSDTNTVKAAMYNDKHIYLVNTTDGGSIAEDYAEDARKKEDQLLNPIWIDPETLESSYDPVDGYVKCWAVRIVESNNNSDRWINACPECNERNDTISMIGTQTATLASLSVGQLLSSNLENAEQRKILAFTNSVQDASHDASFFEARNFRFMFRTAVQKVLGQTTQPISIADLADRFIRHWKYEEPGADLTKYVYSFYPADLEGKHPMKAQVPDNPEFIKEFDLRMAWEIIREFGYGAIIGRTLEKTGSSATFFKSDELREIYGAMTEWLHENGFDYISEDAFIRFLNGVLHRIRLRGGIDHPFLKSYRETPGSYMLNNSNGHWLHRRFGPKQRWPQLVVNYHRKTQDEKNALNSTHRRSDKAPINWFHSYFIRNFFPEDNLIVPYSAVINEFYVKLFDTLTNTEIMDRAGNSESNFNYVLNPAHIYVSGEVKHIRCDSCRNIIHVAQQDTLTESSCCQGHQCNGHYSHEEPMEMSYYYDVYHRNQIPRVFSHEHTGMLDRDKRERIEDSFIKQSEPDAINALVATSTLEMGIDIGDLNSAINISVPPTVANFAQRIGRAGRKTGSSLIVNYIKRDQPHDLYYFAEPKEMMNGYVGTPGCYLGAMEILSRHFYAYCIDSWSADDTGRNNIPERLVGLSIRNDFMSNPDFFINCLHKWIDSNYNNLTSRFESQYEADIRKLLTSDLFPGFRTHYFKIVEDAFRSIRGEYMRLQSDISRIGKEQNSGKWAKTDPEYKELVSQFKMLKQHAEWIEERNVLEFMTDYGLIPNYAFPESGIKLNAVIRMGNEGKHGEITIPDEEFEIVRPASQGIKELAPGNTFFARHYKLLIDGLVTTDWDDKESVTLKRFCSDCDFIENESSSHAPSCPKCGSQSFGAASNVHKFVKLKDVKSWMYRKDAMADDRKDERDKKLYRTSRHFIFTEDNAVSYAMTEIPFGIQYVKQTKLLDVNLGDGDVMTAQNLTINGQNTVQRHGFVVCRSCGKTINNPATVFRKTSAEERCRAWHYPYCKHKTEEYNGHPDNLFEEVYLYRSFNTESIKVLLPVGEIDTKENVAMFKAGLMLGMRDFFGGDPSHIKISDYREMNLTTGKWDNYLVIYDTIPGGSGYLDKLSKTESFTILLKKAYESIRDCQCQHTGKDGCYHCILTYANQYDRSSLSRERAEALFKSIWDKSGQWEEINGTLSGINTSGSIEESELEERFIRTLKRYLSANDGKFTVESIYGSKQYRISLNNREFVIQPQYTLDQAKGVKYYTIADFLISEPGNDDFKPIALYLDGYQFHGALNGGPEPRFFKDIKQRESIILSNRYITWTITWDDLNLADNDKEGKRSDELFGYRYEPTKQMLVQMKLHESLFSKGLNSFDRLMALLHMPNKFDQEVGLLLLQGIKDLRSAAHNYGETGNFLDAGKADYKFPIPSDKKNLYFAFSEMVEDWMIVLASVPGLKPWETQYRIVPSVVSRDLGKASWLHFLRLYNILGLLGYTGVYDSIQTEADDSATATSQISLETLIETYDNEELNEMIELLHKAGIYINPDGYFVIEENGEIVADALLGNEDLKFAVSDDEIASAILEKKGYTVIKPNEIEKLKIKLNI